LRARQGPPWLRKFQMENQLRAPLEEQFAQRKPSRERLLVVTRISCAPALEKEKRIIRWGGKGPILDICHDSLSGKAYFWEFPIPCVSPVILELGRDGRMEGRNAQIGLNGHAWLQRGRITLWTHADATVSSHERSSGRMPMASGRRRELFFWTDR
jgi:hypothetical protein